VDNSLTLFGILSWGQIPSTEFQAHQSFWTETAQTGRKWEEVTARREGEERVFEKTKGMGREKKSEIKEW